MSSATWCVGSDPRQVRNVVGQLYERVSNEGGHVHRTAMAGIEEACWDILGKSLGVPVYQLFGGRVRDTRGLLRQRLVPVRADARGLRQRPRRSGRQGLPGAQVRPLGHDEGLLCSRASWPGPATSSPPSGPPSGRTSGS